jgi:hypothetical protein
MVERHVPSMRFAMNSGVVARVLVAAGVVVVSLAVAVGVYFVFTSGIRAAALEGIDLPSSAAVWDSSWSDRGLIAASLAGLTTAVGLSALIIVVRRRRAARD